jgi:hypothetical protein
MNAAKLLFGIGFIIVAIIMVVIMYQYAIAPAYGFPTIWGDN